MLRYMRTEKHWARWRFLLLLLLCADAKAGKMLCLIHHNYGFAIQAFSCRFNSHRVLGDGRDCAVVFVVSIELRADTPVTGIVTATA